MYRGYSQQQKYQQARARLIGLQSVYRGYSQQQKYQQARARLISLQAAYRGLCQRVKLNHAFTKGPGRGVPLAYLTLTPNFTLRSFINSAIDSEVRQTQECDVLQICPGPTISKM